MILIGRGLDPKAGERKRPEGKREGLTGWRRSGCAVLRVRARRRKRGACGDPGKREEARSPERIPVTMAKGIHLFPYRTQKLSLSAPRVLAWRRAGRVGRCRIPFVPPDTVWGVLNHADSPMQSGAVCFLCFWGLSHLSAGLRISGSFRKRISERIQERRRPADRKMNEQKRDMEGRIEAACLEHT